MDNQKTVLIVDNEIDVINIVETILSNEGYTVLSAQNKDTAINIATKEKPDLIISDVTMSTQYEGFELAKELRTINTFKNTPIIIQTSHSIFQSELNNLIQYAQDYRANIQNSNTGLILVENRELGIGGIDFKNENGESTWLSVNAFIKKPVEAKNLLQNIKQFI